MTCWWIITAFNLNQKAKYLATKRPQRIYIFTSFEFFFIATFVFMHIFLWSENIKEKIMPSCSQDFWLSFDTHFIDAGWILKFVAMVDVHTELVRWRYTEMLAQLTYIDEGIHYVYLRLCMSTVLKFMYSLINLVYIYDVSTVDIDGWR